MASRYPVESPTHIAGCGDWDSEYQELINDADGCAASLLQFLGVVRRKKERNALLLENLSCKIDVAEFETVSKMNRQKIKRENLHVSIFGSTSAGKSTLVNLLIGQTLLPSSANRCTPCCIFLQGTEEPESFFVVDDESEKQSLEDLGRVADQLRAPESACKYIKVYIARSDAQAGESESQFLNFNRMRLCIMDTPGFEQPAFRKSKNSIEASDAFVFVVDSVVGLNEEMTQFFSGICKEYGQPKVLVVFNKWDLVYEEGVNRADELHETYLKEARRFLREININEERSDEKLNESIFFFSANHIKMLRACDSPHSIRNAILGALGNNETLLISGGTGAGRSSIANLLLDHERISSEVSGTSRTVSFECSSSAEQTCIEVGSKEHKLEKLSDLLNEENDSLLDIEERNVRVKLAVNDSVPDWPPGLKMYDCTHCQSVGYLNEIRNITGSKSCTLIIVISAQHSVNNIRERIKLCLEPLIPDNVLRIFLVVNKYDLMMEDHPIDHKKERQRYVSVFAKLCQGFQTPEESKTRVLFTCLRHMERRVTSHQQYRRFANELINYGTESFKMKRFEPIFESLERCRKDVIEYLGATIQKLSDQADIMSKIKSSLEGNHYLLVNESIDRQIAKLNASASIEIATFEATRVNGDAGDSTDNVPAIIQGFVDFLNKECLWKERIKLEKSCTQRLTGESPNISETMERFMKEIPENDTLLPAEEIDVIINQASSFQSTSFYQSAMLSLNEHRTFILQGTMLSAHLALLFLGHIHHQESSLFPQGKRKIIPAAIVSSLIGGGLILLYQHGPTLAKKKQKALQKAFIETYILWRRHTRESWMRAVSQKCYVRLLELDRLKDDLNSSCDNFKTNVIQFPREARSNDNM